MKNALIFTFLSLFLLGLTAGPVWTEGSEGKSTVMEGVLVDTKCYAMDSKNWGNDHDSAAGKMMNCGTACAAMGIPVGLLENGEEGGKLYILLVPSKSLGDHIGQWAKVSGRPAFDGALVVDEVSVKDKEGNYKKVNIITMM